jgi:gliding motility-associated-like protein
MVSIHNDSLGCSDSSGFALEVYPLPEPYAGEDTCICLGDSTQIGAADNPFWTYLWTPTGSVISDPFIYPLVEDTFIVNVADTNNCIGADTLFICVNPLPDIEALSDTVIILGNSADLSAIGGSTYLWESSVSIDCPDCPQIQVVPDTTTYFYLSGLDTNGCAGNDTLLVVVEYEDTVLVPNLFSPNGDGRNDILYVRTFGRFKDIDFKLYNRWGKLVFHTKDENIGWDGYYNDVLQPVDVYVYHLVANTLDGQMFEQKGDITLLR